METPRKEKRKMAIWIFDINLMKKFRSNRKVKDNGQFESDEETLRRVMEKAGIIKAKK